MDPVVSWALFGTGVAAIGYYYYTENNKKISRAREIGGRRRGPQPRLDGKEKRTKGRDSGSSDHVPSDSADIEAPAGNGAQGVKKRKGNKKQPSKLSKSSGVEVGDTLNPNIEEPDDEGMGNAEFAQQITNKQMGTDLQKPTGLADRQRTKKQGKPQKSASQPTNGNALTPKREEYIQQPSAASSTTGADADDDLSPAYSPRIGALSNKMPSATEVSDMLEAPEKGPSILNITAPTNPQPIRQPKAPKPIQEPETKRQRQNKRKKEEQKALRDEAEKERRVLLEKQLRTVREAEGRPAKNGLGISKPPASNAWSKTAEINGGLKASLSSLNQNDTPLLDTFDDSQSSANGATSISGVGANGESSPQAASTSTFTSNTDLPSEEEQLRIISEMDSDNAWNTVNKGGKTKKGKPAASGNAVPNNFASESDKTKKGKDLPSSKFAALDVEHSNEEASSLDKEVEVAASVQLDFNTRTNHSNSEESARYTSDEDVPDASVGSLQLKKDGAQPSTTIIADSVSNHKATAPSSITGLTIPQFLHPSADEAWITKNTPEDDLPKGWYHYDNGCRYGNKKVPHHDAEYERQLQRHASWKSDSPDEAYRHHIKSHLEKEAYERCFLIYRAHLARTLDPNEWNQDNIKQHPAYEPDWPWALLPHPSDGWSAGFHEPNRSCCICEDYSR